MSCYVVVLGNKLDEDSFNAYAEVAGPSIVNSGGEVVSRGPLATLSGTTHFKMMVVVKFPSRERAEGWYNSSEYQAIIPTRDKGLEALFVMSD